MEIQIDFAGPNDIEKKTGNLYNNLHRWILKMQCIKCYQVFRLYIHFGGFPRSPSIDQSLCLQVIK